jgi:hypothetical protein
MYKLRLLNILKEDDYSAFSEHLTGGGDINEMIYKRPLIVHALNLKADQCLYLLLLYGADFECLKKIHSWDKRLYEIDPLFVELIKEMEEGKKANEPFNVQFMLKEASSYLTGNKHLSYRNVLSFFEREKRYFSKLMVGLHLHEYRDETFLFRHIKNIFQCDSVETKSDKKYALVVSSLVVDQLDEKIPGLSHRIIGFVHFVEVPTKEFKKVLEEMEKDEELVIGVHFSDEPGLVEKGEYELDLHPKFFQSLKMTISDALRRKDPVFFQSRFTFNSLLDWDDQIHSWVMKFKKKHSYYPNILLASSETYARIDMVANARGKSKIKDSDGNKATSFVSMSGFQGDGYSLDFCIEERLGVDTVKLIYDSDPEGGLPIPEDEEVSVHVKVS